MSINHSHQGFFVLTWDASGDAISGGEGCGAANGTPLLVPETVSPTGMRLVG